MNLFDPYFILSLLALGTSVGFFAGMLGIGGGGIMVPMLTSIFLWQGIGTEHAVHLALGTSMTSIIATAFSSARAHQKRGAIAWPVVKAMTPGIVIGALIATYLVSKISSSTVAIIFAGFMCLVAANMVFAQQSHSRHKLPGSSVLAFSGCIIGAMSSMVSIGGGTLSVPFLYWFSIPLQRAIATSAAIGFPIAVTGSIGYAWHGNGSVDMPYALGFIYLPAVVLISLCSFFTAPLGAKVAHHLPVEVLRKVFAAVLILLSAKMLWAVFSV